MKNFVDYTSRKCFASARVAPRLGALATQNHSHSQNTIFWTSDPNNYCIWAILAYESRPSEVLICKVDVITLTTKTR
jgi:hypothetical protein